MRKPRPIGPLSSLNPEQKQILRHWFEALTYEQIAERMALPSPDGFGLYVSVWQLRRYFQRLSLDGPDVSADAPSISAIIDRAALEQNIFTPATVHLLEKRSFELAIAQEDPRKISAVFGLVLKARDSATRQRMAELQKQKLAFRQVTGPSQPLAEYSIDETEHK